MKNTTWSVKIRKNDNFIIGMEVSEFQLEDGYDPIIEMWPTTLSQYWLITINAINWKEAGHGALMRLHRYLTK